MHGLFIQEALRRDLSRFATESWPSSAKLNVPDAVWSSRGPGGTGESLAHLMTGDLHWRGGQLILWHGETGTGKTTALRALAREWSSWCEPHYITDPEKFFGDQSDYMLSVMLEAEMFDEDDGEGLDATGRCRS